MFKILSYLAAFLGLTPVPATAAPRPPSRRRTPVQAPRPAVQAAKPATAPPLPAPTRETFAEREARLAFVSEARASDTRDRVVAGAARLLAIAYDPSDMRFMTPQEIEGAEQALGPALHQYLRACHIAGVRIPTLGDGQIKDAARRKAFRADLEQRVVVDLDTWDRAWLLVSRAITAAERHGEPVPPKLVIPDDVQAAIAQMHARKAERLQRRQGGQAGQTGTAIPGGTPSGTPPVTTTKKDDGEEDPTPSGPSGPK